MYEETVYLLDLCILSYHLHAQTLIWPFDPYYECSKEDQERKRLMTALRDAFPFGKKLDIHGPGSCQGTETDGWYTNATLEPIFSDYRRIYPWRPSFTRPDAENEPWIVYDTPVEITGRIGEVRMARYGPKFGPYHKSRTVQIDLIHSTKPGSTTAQPAPDVLYCFEGGTGAVHGENTQRQYPAWSMMGFVLAQKPDPSTSDYDIYIVFRGSRSGELRPDEAGWKAKGNPDWVTDLQLLQPPVKEKQIFDSIEHNEGMCVPGFAASLKTMLLTVMEALKELHKAKQQAPRYIYVTGHSLGGALASLFTSAILFGNEYGPNGTGPGMPKELNLWPWKQISLRTFSTPAVGDDKFKTTFDETRPGNRIYVKGDPITKQALGKKAVGIPDIIQNVTNVHAHQPLAVRRSLIEKIRTKSLQHLHKIPRIMEDDQPWKLFKSKRLDDMLATFAKGKKPTELAAIIPDCEPFLLVLLDALPFVYLGDKKETALKTEIQGIAKEITQLKGRDAFTKVKSLCARWQNCGALAKKGDVYKLIGLCLFFNAVSSDGNVYTDPDTFGLVKPLIGLS